MSKKSCKIKTLPLVDEVCLLHSKTNLEDIAIIGAQHILPTTVRMFHSLIKNGLKAKNVSLIGKCYSTDKPSLKRMQEMGLFVDPNSTLFEPERPFSYTFSSALREFMHRNLSEKALRKFKKVILVDDGGELFASLHKNRHPFSVPVIGVKQSTFGYDSLFKYLLQFPVINVARSKAKLVYEAPIIVDSILFKLKSRLLHLHNQNKKVLIVGHGTIGQALYRALEGEFTTKMCDKQYENIDEEDFKRSLYHYDIIIGCTGSSILSPFHYPYLKKGTLLISTSCADVEFSAHLFRRRALYNNAECHQDILLNDVSLINCGFPLNFDGDVSSLDPESFQLTRALLTSAIYQGVEYDGPSQFIGIDEEDERVILSKYMELYPLAALESSSIFPTTLEK